MVGLSTRGDNKVRKEEEGGKEGVSKKEEESYKVVEEV